MSRHVLLARAITLIPSHGFTRTALRHSPTGEPLSESAVTALFGRGEEAERALIGAWMEEGRVDMRREFEADGEGSLEGMKTGMRSGSEREGLYRLLARRLRYNEPVLQYLPDVRHTSLLLRV
jgi:ubiquinone biosynthesis protein COQ9